VKAAVLSLLRSAELYHRKHGHFEEAVAYQQYADAVDANDGDVLECECALHEMDTAKSARLQKERFS